MLDDSRDLRRLEPGQESVWDYPRPPRLEACAEWVRIECDGLLLAESCQTLRMLETSHPPVYYIPETDIRKEFLRPSQRASWCEWKGQAGYVHVQLPDRLITNAGWFYPNPSPSYSQLKGHYAFYAHCMDACYVGEERVEAQPGDFYGGWITSKIVGPFKGPPGTRTW